MSKPSANEIVASFVLERSQDLDLEHRSMLFRAMSELIGDETDAAHFLSLANDLDAFAARHQQLALDFKRRGI